MKGKSDNENQEKQTGLRVIKKLLAANSFDINDED